MYNLDKPGDMDKAINVLEEWLKKQPHLKWGITFISERLRQWFIMHPCDDKLLKLRPDTVTTIRKMYNLDNPKDMERAIDALEQWLSKQYHFTKREYSREFLERSIILMKGSVERAKSQIENICSMRSIFPVFFDKYDARNDFEDMNSVLVDAVLPNLTKDHYRVYVVHFRREGTTNDNLMDLYRFGILKSEYVKAHDYCNGFVAIVDYRNVNVMNLLTVADIPSLLQLTKIIIEGYGMRVKAIHSVTTSKAIELLLKMLRPILSPKIASRLYIHTSIESLYDHVSKDILPPELGGYGESLSSLSEQCKNTLGTKENIEYMKEMSKAVSNQAHRMKEKMNGLDLGLAGTFRTLSVD